MKQAEYRRLLRRDAGQITDRFVDYGDILAKAVTEAWPDEPDWAAVVANTTGNEITCEDRSAASFFLSRMRVEGSGMWHAMRAATADGKMDPEAFGFVVSACVFTAAMAYVYALQDWRAWSLEKAMPALEPTLSLLQKLNDDDIATLQAVHRAGSVNGGARARGVHEDSVSRRLGEIARKTGRKDWKQVAGDLPPGILSGDADED